MSPEAMNTCALATLQPQPTGTQNRICMTKLICCFPWIPQPGVQRREFSQCSCGNTEHSCNERNQHLLPVNMVSRLASSLQLSPGTTYSQVKVSSYIAHYPILRIARNAPWQTCSIIHHLDFSRMHPTRLQLMPVDYSYTGICHCL